MQSLVKIRVERIGDSWRTKNAGVAETEIMVVGDMNIGWEETFTIPPRWFTVTSI
jgi:hypothetical protein